MDRWFGDCPLLQHEGALRICDTNCTASSFFKNQWWDVDKLRDAPDETLVPQIINILVGVTGILPDSQIWRPSTNGVFSVKTAYHLLFSSLDWHDSPWSYLCHLKGFFLGSKIFCFIFG